MRIKDNERAVSIAVTHVLAIGITTLLISTLLIGASGVLEEQKERAAQQELETIGNRVSTQITSASRLASTGDSVTFRVSQPTRVSGGTYTLDLITSSPQDACDGASLTPDPGTLDACLVLEATNLNVEVSMPVHIPGPTPDVRVVGSGEILITAP